MSDWYIDRSKNFDRGLIDKILFGIVEEIKNSDSGFMTGNATALGERLFQRGVPLASGNIAAVFTRLKDHGFLQEDNRPGEIAQLYLDGLLSYEEMLLELLVKRSADKDIGTDVKPLVILCKVFFEMSKILENQADIFLTYNECKKYLLPIADYANITEDFVKQLIADRKYHDGEQYPDPCVVLDSNESVNFGIWLNALTYTGLMCDCDSAKLFRPNLSYLPLIKYLANRGDKIKKGFDRRGELYAYLGNKTTGFYEAIEDVPVLAGIIISKEDSRKIYDYLFGRKNSLRFLDFFSKRCFGIYAPFINFPRIAIRCIERSSPDLAKKMYEFIMDIKTHKAEGSAKYQSYLSAIKTKPFVLLAGISGTGKSRLVRELAKATCCDVLKDVQKPGNFEMIQVRPNWHDSTELMGYVSRTSKDGPQYIITDYIRFLAKAWLFKDVPFFLCLDEMNLAPVEQYFAEYLSVIETRKYDPSKGEIVTDVLVKLDELDKRVLEEALNEIFSADWAKPEEHGRVEQLKEQFKKGISIPPNLIVMGTVNMDETTFSFSRKVLDRAMSFELNIVNLQEGLEGDPNEGLKIEFELVIGNQVEAADVYSKNKDVCDKVVAYLENVNELLGKTPFKTAYRTRNEAMIYVVDRIAKGASLEEALDEITHMKILSRIEGDKQKLGNLLDDLSMFLQDKLKLAESNSVKKLKEMAETLVKTEYVDFWG